jgi:lysophospholipase L1-like esterase/chitodextrinase
VPRNLSAAAVSGSRVNLSWSAATDTGGTVAGYKVYRDGSFVTQVTGLSYNDTGLTARTTYSYTVSAIDDAVPANESAQSSPVSVTTLDADTTPPSVPQNLTATAVSPTQVNLGWSPSTDSGGGSVAGYKVFRNGAEVAQVTLNRYDDTGLAPSTSYSYTVSAFDDAVPANQSAKSSPAKNASTPANPGSVNYNFTAGTNMADWLEVDNTGIASNWQLVSGRYSQSVDVGDQDFGTPFNQSYKLGTYSYLSSLTALTGYSVSVDITPTRDTPPRDQFDGQDVGVMFRYTNNNNYYRVSFSARESFARLEKKVGGVFTTLATNARGYVDGQTFNVSVNLSGSLIQVTRDGDPLFAVRDTALANGTVALYCQDSAQFDNVVIDASDPGPTLVVATPLAHSVQVGNTVTAAAAVTHMPDGGSVDFEFGGAPCAAATESAPGSGFFTASCGSKAQGDYFLGGQGLRGLLRNSGGGVVASDENLRVGIQGDRYVSVGDSITLGTFDFFRADNQSLDGRVFGKQGYQARLVDLLTTATGYPNIVFNEGVGADKTADTLTRIDSILARHAGANKMLLLLGTNDSGGGTPVTPATFKTNMQSLVNKMTAQGKTVRVAKIPPVLPAASNTTRNADIQAYNAAIDTLSNIQAGPDFYAFFYDNNSNAGNDSDRFSMYADKLHPNALGAHIMADLWNNALTGASTTPFFLQRLCSRLVSADCTAELPTNHKQNLLQAGNTTYIDAAFTLTSVPAALTNGIWIQTANANAERNNTAASYIDFTVDRPVTVYVAYDAGAAALPNWLRPANGYADTGLNVQTTDPLSPTLRVYSKSFIAGPVSLGGNLAAGASGADSNFLVVVAQ